MKARKEKRFKEQIKIKLISKNYHLWTFFHLVLHSIFSLDYCGGLTLAGCQVPTKAALLFSLLSGQGRENIIKGSWVKIRTGRDHSAFTVTGKTDSAWRILI